MADDKRTGVLIAVDGAKTLFSIGVAFFVALGGFAITYRSGHRGVDWPTQWPLWLLGGAAVAAMLSLLFGLKTIGVAYRQGDGNAASWDATALYGKLRAQSLWGLAALALFVAAVYMWNAAPPADSLDDRLRKMQDSITELDGRMTQLGAEIGRNNQSLAAAQAAAAQAASRVDAAQRRIGDLESKAAKP